MRLIPTLALALMLPLLLSLPRTALAERSAVEQVIRNQIAAFQADDFATAFSFASPNIRRLFGTSQNFGTMVQRGYPMVWRPTALAFLDHQKQEGGAVQRIEVQDKSGKRHQLDYLMVETDQGWRIDGVFLRPPMDTGV